MDVVDVITAVEVVVAEHFPVTRHAILAPRHVTQASEPLLDQLAGYAINYYEDFVKPAKVFRGPTEQERAAMEALVTKLKVLPPGADAEAIQNEVFEVGKAAGFEPLRAWFSALYEVLLGQSQGPRFGSFVAIFGVERTVALIERALAGELTAA